MEKAKQDDGLADLSDLLSELKNMAVDMGTEIERFFFHIYQLSLCRVFFLDKTENRIKCKSQAKQWT